MRLWAILAALHLAVLVAFVANAAVNGPPHGDWVTFRLAAERAFGGQLGEVWATDFEAVRIDRWFYPPYALWLYLPLRGLSDRAAFLLCAGAQLVAAATAAALLVRELAIPRERAVAALLVFFGSAALQYDVMLGQNGATFLLAYAAAAVLLRRGRPLAAGLALAPLGIKPNFTPPAALALLLRDRRALAVFVGAGVLLVAIGAPFGAQAWRDFATAGANQVAYATSALGGRHNLTVHGLLLALTGRPWLAQIGWALASVVALAALVRVVRASDDPLRRISATVLFTLATNVYVNAYDGVVLLVPALDLLARPLPRPVDRGLWAAIFVAWLVDARTWLWPMLLPLEPGTFSLVGAVAWVWLGVWSVRERG